MTDDIDPLDKLISAVQGKPITEPVPVPNGTVLALPVVDNVHNIGFDSLGRPDLTEKDRVILWYREIERLLSSTMTRSEQIERMSNWRQFKMVVSSTAQLSLMEERARINHIIELAIQQNIGRYPTVLFAFEWYDTRLQKTLRQEMPGGFCRG
jgi:hypothetical protein